MVIVLPQKSILMVIYGDFVDSIKMIKEMVWGYFTQENVELFRKVDLLDTGLMVNSLRKLLNFKFNFEISLTEIDITELTSINYT